MNEYIYIYIIRRKKLLYDLKDRRGYSHLKEEALDRTVWRKPVARGVHPVGICKIIKATMPISLQQNCANPYCIQVLRSPPLETPVFDKLILKYVCI
jgi:hypothetical protein